MFLISNIELWNLESKRATLPISSGPHWWKPRRKRPIGEFLWIFFVVTSCKGKFSAYYMTSLFSRPSNRQYTLFELRYFCCLAPLEHWAEVIQLSEEVSKVLGHLSWTFSSHKKRLPLRRLWSKFTGAILTNMLLKDLVIRTGGPFIDVLMLYHACSCCKQPFGVNFVEIGSFVD